MHAERVVQSPINAWQSNLDTKAQLAARYRRESEFRRRLPAGHALRQEGRPAQVWHLAVGCCKTPCCQAVQYKGS